MLWNQNSLQICLNFLLFRTGRAIRRAAVVKESTIALNYILFSPSHHNLFRIRTSRCTTQMLDSFAILMPYFRKLDFKNENQLVFIVLREKKQDFGAAMAKTT
ncbi:hypothetical protein DL96DRAFT_1017817 [Flagelloscypha sp. PMI_526]|nr:hypothetical protein DL96DRAFT_1017817 [Flagelloscypha sp. PMI_526]